MNGLAITFLRPRDMRVLEGEHPREAAPVVANLTRRNAIWAAQLLANPKTGNPEAYEALCKWHPSVMRCGYFAISIAREADYGWYNWKVMQAHPEWFVREDRSKPHGPDNRKAYKEDAKHPAWYVDVRVPEFREFAISEMVNWTLGLTHRPPLTAPGRSFDAFGADIVCVGPDRMADIVGEDHVADWDRAMYRLLADLKAALNSVGKKVIANHKLPLGQVWVLEGKFIEGEFIDDDWHSLVDSVDGVMTEQPLGGAPDEWENAIRVHEAIIEADTIDWWTCYPKVGDGDREFMFYYGSYLLTCERRLSLFSAGWPECSGRSLVSRWNGAYNLCLGEPIGPRKQVGTCHKRQYENGIVVVNPTPYVANIEGAELPPVSGRILQ